MSYSILPSPYRVINGPLYRIFWGVNGTVNVTSTTTNMNNVSWNWGDGNITYNDNNPTHTYATVRRYVASVIGEGAGLLSTLNISNNNIDKLDISSLQNLQELNVSNNVITEITIGNNVLLNSLDISDNTNITPAILDTILRVLDENGLENGYLNYNNTDIPTEESCPHYYNLLGKNWDLQGPVPDCDPQYTGWTNIMISATPMDPNSTFDIPI